MKNLPIFICILIVSIILTIGCNAKNKIDDKKENIENKNLSTIIKQSENPNQKQAEKVTANNEIFKSASQGKINGIEFGIGTRFEEIIKTWGEPEEKGNYEGSNYLIYDDITFMADENSEVVSRIAISGEREVYGVKIGMKPSEIKKILGEPKYESIYEDTDIQQRSIVYENGEYRVMFCSDDIDTPVNFMIIQK